MAGGSVRTCCPRRVRQPRASTAASSTKYSGSSRPSRPSSAIETMNSLEASNWIGGRKGAASSTAIGTSAGRRASRAAAPPRTITPSTPAAAPPALVRRSSGPVPSDSISPASPAASSTNPASNVKRPRASSTSTAASAPPTAASWAVSACSTGAQISRVIGGGRLANAFAPRRHQLLASVNEVTLRIVAGKQYRGRCPHHVRPGPAHPPQRTRDGHAVLPEVEVAVAVELHDPTAHGRFVRGELVVVHGASMGDEQDVPAGVVQPPAEVRLVRVDEEVGIEPANLLGGLAPHEHRARLHPAHVGGPPGAGGGPPRGGEELRARRGGARVAFHGVDERPRRALTQLGVLVQQQAVPAARLAQERRVVLRLAGAPLQREQASVGEPLAHRIGRAVVRRVIEHQHLVLQLRWVGALDRLEAGDQVLAAVRVDHAVREDQRAASSSTRSARAASWSRSNSRSARARALRPMRSASSGCSRSQAIRSASARASPARTYTPASFSSTSSRIQPSMFTIAGRPAAKVSNSLLGELVASSGTSLKSVWQALDPAASSATSSLPPAGPVKTTLDGAPRSSSGRRLPSPTSTNSTSGRGRAASTAAVRSLASPIVPK